MAIADPEVRSTSSKAQLRARARTRFNQSMKLVRRAHLYAGLLMTPWVFLYGVTALLFNHPQLFPDVEQTNRAITPADLAGTPLETFPKPQALATQVVDAINAAAGPEATTRYRLVKPEEAAFAREYTTAIPGGSADHLVRLDLANGSGSIRTTPSRKEPERDAPLPFARRPITLESAPMEAINTSLSMLLTRLDLPQAPVPTRPAIEPERGREQGEGGERRRGRRDDSRSETDRSDGEELPDRPRANERPGRPGSRSSANVAGRDESRSAEPRGERPERRDEGTRRRDQAENVIPAGNAPAGPRGRGVRGPIGPELSFLMQGDGTVWRVGYNLQTGLITGRAGESSRNAEPLSSRRFLLRLHTAHGYPSQWSSRVVWAAIVDIMAVCMVGWGLTGLMMWWQMKNVRRIGAVLLVLSVIGAVVVAIGMHHVMVNGA